MAENQPHSLGGVVQEAAGHVQDIVRSEIRLARAELAEEAAKAKGAAAMFGGSALMGYFAGALVIVTADRVLSAMMPKWLASSILAGACGFASVSMFGSGRALLKELGTPEKTVQTVKENIEWAQNQKR
jgi:uncharacterized membrane protein YqjE